MRAHNDAHPQPIDTTWDELAVQFSKVRATELPKSQLPAWVPARLDATQQRRAQNTIEVTALVLDIDHATLEQRARIFARLDGFEHVYHSTYSYDPLQHDGLNYRVIVQLTKPVPAAQWKPFRAACVDMFGASGAADSKTQDPCRLYYMPMCPADGPAPDSGRARGIALDVDLILANLPSKASTPAGDAPKPSLTATTADLRRIIPPRIRDIANDFVRTGVQALANLLEGKDYAESGERDNTLFALAQLLAHKFPHHTSESLVSPLALTIDFHAEAGSSDNTSAVLRDKIERAQAQVIEELRGEDPIRMGQIARPGPYTPEEIAEYLKAHSLESAEALAKQLILNYRGDLYVFYEGDYKLAGSTDTGEDEIRHLLRPAITLPGVTLREVNAKGVTVEKPMKRLRQEYGLSLVNVVPTFELQQSRVKHRTLEHAICPRRKFLRPVFDQTTAEWLATFDPKLTDWLATAPRLEKPTAALFMHGARGTGKSMLANGLATIWANAATELASLGVNFNGDITGNPIVFADETLPLEYKQDTGLIRRMITAHSTKLRRKYMNESNLMGAVRVVIAQNNLDLFSHSEATLTQYDIEAICERLLYAHFGTKRAPYIPPQTLAQHVLWLEKNHPVQSADRLWVEGEDSPLHRNMRISSRSRSVVCQWLAGLIMNPALVSERRAEFRMDQYGLQISPRLIYDRFDTYCGKEKQISLRDVSKVIQEIGTRRGRNMYQIHLADLAQWGASHAFEASEQEIAEMVAAGGANLLRAQN